MWGWDFENLNPALPFDSVMLMKKNFNQHLMVQFVYYTIVLKPSLKPVAVLEYMFLFAFAKLLLGTKTKHFPANLPLLCFCSIFEKRKQGTFGKKMRSNMITLETHKIDCTQNL